jgi:protein SCO1/2
MMIAFMSSTSAVSAATSDQSVFNLDSSWTNQNSQLVPLKDALKDHVTVVAMIYTSCRGACPMLVARMKEVERRLSPTAKPRVHFALFSFDEKRDTPTKLLAYARAHKLDLSRWALYTAPTKTARELAMLLDIKFKESDAGGEFEHSNVITVLDPAGVIRFRQTGLKVDPTPLIAAIHGPTPAP